MKRGLKQTTDRSQIIARLKKVLDRQRFEHSLRVEKIAVRLARRHGVSVKKASIAALLHDYARQLSRPRMLSEARKAGLKIDRICEFEPKLLHAPLSARMAKKDFGITSREILSAIARHTIGSAGMSKLDKIVYLADHIEEGRIFLGVKSVRRLAFKDMDRAVIASTTRGLLHLLKKGLPFHPGTVKTRNYYIMKK